MPPIPPHIAFFAATGVVLASCAARAGVVGDASPTLQPLEPPEPPTRWAALRHDPRTAGPARFSLETHPKPDRPEPGPRWEHRDWSWPARPDRGPAARLSLADPVPPGVPRPAREPARFEPAGIPMLPDTGRHDGPIADHDAGFGHAILLARVAPLPAPGVPAALLIAGLVLGPRRRSTPRRRVPSPCAPCFPQFEIPLP